MRRTDFSEGVPDNISLKWFEDSVPDHQAVTDQAGSWFRMQLASPR